MDAQLRNSATYGVVASLFLTLIGYQGIAQWTVARAFKHTMALTTGVRFRLLGPAQARLTAHRPAVFVGNHQTALDVLLLGTIFPRYCSVTAKKSLKLAPFLGWFMALDARDWFWLLGAALAVVTLWFINRADAFAPAASLTTAGGSSVRATAATAAPAQQTTDLSGNAEDLEEFSAPTGAVLDDAQELDDYVRLPIPFGTLKSPSGSLHNLRDLASSQARVLLWVSPTCGPCIDVIEQIPTWHEKLPMLGVHPVVARQEDIAQIILL